MSIELKNIDSYGQFECGCFLNKKTKSLELCWSHLMRIIILLHARKEKTE